MQFREAGQRLEQRLPEMEGHVRRGDMQEVMFVQRLLATSGPACVPNLTRIAGRLRHFAAEPCYNENTKGREYLNWAAQMIDDAVEADAARR